MEVFRSDSSGRDYANERLFRLVKRIKENTFKDFFENILVINDNKGDLYIHLKDEGSDIDYYYSVFKVFWYLENEYEIKIFINNNLVLE